MENLKFYTVIIFTFQIVLVNCCVSTQINDACELNNGSPGKCVRIENCPHAIELIRSRKASPKQCGFEGRHPVICCDSKVLLEPLINRRNVGDISKQKCAEAYESLLVTTRKPIIEEPPLPKNLSFAELIALAEQENINAHTSAVGGYNAIPREFLHMAALGYGERDQITWGCGGSLISKKFVLTAGHCIHTNALGTVKFVRLGDLNLKSNTDDANIQDFDIIKLFVHPNYRAPSVYHDIALIELSKEAVIDNFVRPGCISADNNIPGEDLSATGWGVTSFNGEQADHLQEVKLRLFTFESCQKAYASMSKRRLANGIDDKSQVCAGEDHIDTCLGDSGGPLQIKNPQYPRGYRVIGITSFGKACGIGVEASVYTRVSHYIEWIESIVWPEWA
ncbi:serine protease snake-like [Atheta coriaria]|uniref:serine protease snake-like n=1 Tax=Dalotia coriaria TaxID=877792 RepID=UPI0031F3AA48